MSTPGADQLLRTRSSVIGSGECRLMRAAIAPDSCLRGARSSDT